MKIYLELLVLVFIPIIIFILWYLWRAWSRKRLLKKYDPDKDLGKLAEDKRKEGRNHDGKTKTREGGGKDARVGREKSSVGTAVENSTGLTESKGRELLQTTEAVDDGKTSNSNRKNGRSIRNLFKRRTKS